MPKQRKMRHQGRKLPEIGPEIRHARVPPPSISYFHNPSGIPMPPRQTPRRRRGDLFAILKRFCQGFFSAMKGRKNHSENAHPSQKHQMPKAHLIFSLQDCTFPSLSASAFFQAHPFPRWLGSLVPPPVSLGEAPSSLAIIEKVCYLQKGCTLTKSF